MNGTLERPVEEKIESRKSVFTHEEENIFFSGVLRRYHLDAVGKADGQNQENALFLRGNGGQAGVLDSKNLALYSYAHQNPLIYIDPDGRKTWPVANTTIRIEPGNIFVGYFNALRPGNKGGLHRGVDIAGSIAATGDAYQAIINIFNTLPFPKVALGLLIITMIAFYATTFDAITMVVSSYTYKQLDHDQEPDKRVRIYWAILFILLPIALVFAESSRQQLYSLSIIAAFPIGIIIILIAISFFKDANKYFQENKKQVE